MEPKVILHIPHSSTNIPLLDGYIVDTPSLEMEMLKLTDWFTDDLFYCEDEVIVKADFSRIFCDPERFADDEQEIMAQYGMGVLYQKSDEGKTIRIVSQELREKILTEYYWSHHKKFIKEVNNQLIRFGKVQIIDCHSFPAKPLLRDLDRKLHRPDFNIGTDDFHTPKHLIEMSIEFFRGAGYTLGVNWPYKGSIVPLEHYKKNENVRTIMLEVNRTLYLKGSTNEKSENYSEIKRVTGEFIKMIKKDVNKKLM